MNMRPFVESLRRLYVQGRISLEKIQSFLTEGKITQEEYDYIVTSPNQANEQNEQEG